MAFLLETEAKRLLSKHGIRVNYDRPASSRSEAADAAASLGFPAAMKVLSPNIIHKTDAGGVFLNVRDEREAMHAYDSIMAAVREKEPSARIEGVLVSPMVRGVETIVGAKKDAQFGPVVMFGLGGVFVEVLRDVSFRVVPIYRRDAASMVREIKSRRVLEGVRGKKPVNVRAIEDALLKVSRLMEREKNVEELDINPLIVDSRAAVVVDARVITSG